MNKKNLKFLVKLFTAVILLVEMFTVPSNGNTPPETSTNMPLKLAALDSPERVADALKQEGATLNLYWPSGGTIKTWIVNKLVPGYKAYVKQKYGVDITVNILATEGGDRAFFQNIKTHEQTYPNRNNFDIDVVRLVPSIELLEAGEKGWFLSILPDSAKVLPNLALVNQPGLQSFTIDGKTYAIPIYQPTISFFYNKERVPNPPQSVQELLSWAKANPGRFTYEDPRGSSGSSGLMFLLTVMKTFGDLDNPDINSQGFQFLRELQKYIYPQPPEFPAPLNSSQMLELMKHGDVWLIAFWNDFGLSVVRDQNLTFIKNYFPKEGMPVRNTPIAVPKLAAHKIAGLLFLNYTLSDKVQRQLAQFTQQIPASISCEVWKNLPLATFNYDFPYIQSHTFAAFHSKQNLTDIKRIVDRFPTILEPHHQLRPFFNTQVQVKIPPTLPSASKASLKQKAKQLMVLGDQQYQNSQWEAALESFEQALTIYRRTGDRQDEAANLNFIGLDNFVAGHSPEAFNSWQQSATIYREIGDRAAEQNMLFKIAAVYDNLGWYSQAQEFYEQSSAIGREIGVSKAPQIVSAHSCLGHYTQPPELSEAIGDALLRSGNLMEAAKTLLAVIKDLNPVRQNLSDRDKVSIFDSHHAGAYRILQEIFITQHQEKDALEISEQGRARAFAELLASRLSSTPVAQISPPTVKQIQQIAKEQNATLVEYSIIYDRFKTPDKPQPQASKLFIWVIKPTGEITFRYVDLKSFKINLAYTSELGRVTASSSRGEQADTVLDSLVRGAHKSLGVSSRDHTSNEQVTTSSTTPSPSTNNPYLQRLHKLLIQPIADLLPKDPHARVIFIPQSSLFLVPFAALQNASGKYLIEQHTILVAPAIQVLDLTHRRRPHVPGAAKDVLVVGNPTMPKILSHQLRSLLGAEQEATEIARLLNTKATIGNQATKAYIIQQMPKAKVIHLATHGLMDDFKGQDIPGAIALAPSGNDDGLLTSSEILDMKLNAELVVLSACNTGLGDITSDGVIGLSRSLISAGVPTVVVSLWDVPDTTTAFLMPEFYRQMQQNRDKAQALRQAMLKTMKQYPRPRDWAAFTLIGEAE